MATLTSLKQALRQEIPTDTPSSSKVPLSDLQYSKAFEIFMRGSEKPIYEDFIVPRLSQLLDPLFSSRLHISVLEVGPGPRSILGHLPDRLKSRIKRYVAFEPNKLFAAELEAWIAYGSNTSPFQQLGTEPCIRRARFTPDTINVDNSEGAEAGLECCFDVVLFCHSMYGMKPRRTFVERALELLAEGSQDGIVAIFHRDEVLDFDGLVCHRAASFPTGQVRVADDDDNLDHFASFIAGFNMQDANLGQTVRTRWRERCRMLCHRDTNDPDHIIFRAPETMLAFTRHATALKELTDQVPLFDGIKPIKNREARARTPAAIVRPREIQHIRHCVLWALRHGVGLTVIGGGHSGQCIWSNVVAVDMSAFNKVHIHAAGGNENADPESGPLIFLEAGCKTDDIIRETMAAGLTVPLGDRPSVGMGIWLQGGIGHLSRLHGLACDTIVGAVMVGVESGQYLCLGSVPSQHWPVGAVRPECESDLLQAIKGAGTNFGIVVGITCKAFAAPTYSVQNWVIPLNSKLEARKRFDEFDSLVASQLPLENSADAFLFFDNGTLSLGATMFEVSTNDKRPSTIPKSLDAFWGPGEGPKASDGIELFDAGLYVSKMHNGHTGGKTSSFKRCLFLKHIARVEVVDRLISIIENRPSPLCYVHLLQGGGTASKVAPGDTAFGCRDWDFACVITGVWPRDEDGTELASSVVQWVYEATGGLLPVSSGVYSADLGPDPRDARLAMEAFGPNLPHLARLKRKMDPGYVLAYACPLPMSKTPKVVVLVTGKSCSGKDFCAEVWRSSMTATDLTALVASISDVTKREYAAATGADFNLLIHDRTYKENHRPRLTDFFQDQLRSQPRSPEKHFQKVIDGAGQVDILFVTGMREEAPVSRMSHLIPGSKVIEINVQADSQTRIRRGLPKLGDDSEVDSPSSHSKDMSYHPGLIFNNSMTGEQEARRFAGRHLLPLLHQDLQRLKDMIRTVPDFPRPGFEFRHVLGICQRPGGLELCTALLQKHSSADWNKVDAIASCESGGFVYASALASRVNVPLVLIREAGKLPPPTVSVVKSQSFVTSSTSSRLREQRVELEHDAVPKGGTIVVVDDVLSTGQTLRAILELLKGAGIRAENISVMVVAEFPIHRGRELLRRSGFAMTNVQSMVVYDGA